MGLQSGGHWGNWGFGLRRVCGEEVGILVAARARGKGGRGCTEGPGAARERRGIQLDRCGHLGLGVAEGSWVGQGVGACEAGGGQGAGTAAVGHGPSVGGVGSWCWYGDVRVCDADLQLGGGDGRRHCGRTGGRRLGDVARWTVRGAERRCSGGCGGGCALQLLPGAAAVAACQHLHGGPHSQFVRAGGVAAPVLGPQAGDWLHTIPRPQQ
mmetsp:Transcript_53057/g.94700  ORF Transcript_53057/g.94700 Transcript_53057/m.94700 type:complete len:211 (+) Transcript_53057:356-988(+)